MYRQGDVLLRPIEWVKGEWNSRSIVRKPSYGPGSKISGIILAEGEATGHHHRVKGPNARRARRGGKSGMMDVLLVGKKGTTLVHEEHDTITLPHGAYEIVRQREYEPAEKRRERRVFD